MENCRICGSGRLYRYLDLGSTPLANSYLAEKDLGAPEFSEELCLQVCRDCGLSQLTKAVPPDLMFRHYLYVSSTTATIRDHFAELARTAAKAAGAKKGDLALDIASNDGCLLAAFQAEGLKAVGVDPAENLAAEANAKGLTTECAYWTADVAAALAQRLGKAKVITAANVFAHADDLQGFMEGIKKALAPDGLFVIECPWVVDFLEKGEFDTAYHEHVSYVGVTPAAALMARHGFAVVDVEHFPEIHGGTIRVFCAWAGARKASPRAAEALAREQALGLKETAVYDAFSKAVLANRLSLRALVARLRAEGKTIWAYGASAKGNTLMNFFGLKAADIPCAIDDNPKKWDLYTPGARMRIAGIDALKTGRPDVLLLLAWNFEREIRARCRAAGYVGDFIVPVPQARLLSGKENK
ncbi:MAG: class I SAM-dependent methyltransferase [Elusimicrobiota bacterium]